MRIQDLHIAVALTTGFKTKVLYAGDDAVEAQKAYREAGEEFAEVGVIAHPQCVFPRFPAEEAAAAVARAKAAEASGNAELVQAQREANLAQAAAEKAAEEAAKAGERLRALTEGEAEARGETPLPLSGAADEEPKKKGKKAK